MFSVMRRVRNTKQPRGGYLPIRTFSSIALNDNRVLAEENISANLVGMAVDYLTRVALGTDKSEAFKISIAGSERVREKTIAKELLSGIKGMDASSVKNACKLVGYDVCFRAGTVFYKPIAEIEPDDNTIENIRIMVERGIEFWANNGPIISEGFTFQGGYTDIVSSGDGDYITKDTLWDFKVSKKPPTKNDSLQILMYYLMGRRSIHEEFNEIKNLGIFNPRLNTIYLKHVDEIPDEVLEYVSKEIIGYRHCIEDI